MELLIKDATAARCRKGRRDQMAGQLLTHSVGWGLGDIHLGLAVEEIGGDTWNES